MALDPLLAYGIPFIVSLSSVQMVLSYSFKELAQTMGLFHSKKAGDETVFDTQCRQYYTSKTRVVVRGQ